MRSPRSSMLWTAMALAALAAPLAGCGLVDWVPAEAGARSVGPDPDHAERLPDGAVAMAYPIELEIGEPLDIEVVRVGNTIRLENRTTRSFGPVQVWLNHEYGALVESIPVGRGEPIRMRGFVNHHGERYPVGRFLVPEADRPLVLVDLATEGRIHKLTVRLPEDWRGPGAIDEPARPGARPGRPAQPPPGGVR